MDRRDFLNDVARLAALSAVVPSAWRVSERPRLVDDPFQLEVAAGDPTATGGVLWTRLAPRPLEPEGGMDGSRTVVRWEVAEDDAFRRIVRQGRATAAPELSYSLHIDVDGLAPDPLVPLPIRRGRRDEPGGSAAHHAPGRRPDAAAVRLRIVPALRGRPLHRVRAHGARGARPRCAPRRLHLRVRRGGGARPPARGPPVRLPLDSWSGYPAARDRLLGRIAEHTPNRTVVLTGDIHMSWASELRSDFSRPDRPTVAAEFVGTSISSGGDGSVRPGWVNATALAEAPHLRWYDARRGYVRCTVAPDAWTTDYRLVPFVSRHGAPIETASRWLLAHGRPGLERA